MTVATTDRSALSRLQIHLSEEHGPLGLHPSVTGTAWDDLEELEKRHARLHENHTWAHSHRGSK